MEDTTEKTEACNARHNAGVTQLAEYLPSKQNVVGSIPITRFPILGRSMVIFGGYFMRLSNRTTNKLRSYLRSLSRRRNSGTVTADDVHTFLNRNTNIDENSSTLRVAFVNKVFQSPDFEPVGYTRSTRPAARGRVITEWMA